MTDVREVLNKAVASYESPTDEAAIERRMERMRRKRRAAAATIALVVFVGAGWFAWTTFQPGRPVVSLTDQGTYVLSSFEVSPYVDERTGELDRSQADVTFTPAWSFDVYPGEHECRIEVFDAAGSSIGSLTFQMASLSEQMQRSRLTVPVTGPVEGASATGSCAAARLDVPIAYTITNERLDYVDGRLAIAYRVDWPDELGAGQYPSHQACTAAVWSSTTELLWASRFTLGVGEGTLHVDVDGVPPGEGAEASVTCEPYTRENVFPTPEHPSGGAVSPATHAALDDGMAFIQGELVRFGRDGREVVATFPDSIAPVPPVATRSGVVVLTGDPSIGLALWLVSPDGSLTQIAEDVTAGFAVDPANDLVAYATTVQAETEPYFSPVIHLVNLTTGEEVATSSELDVYAEVDGVIDGRVLLSTGDGAGAAAGVWDPATDEVFRYFTYGRAESADAASGIAVLNVGDGRLPILVRFREQPTDTRIIPGEIVVDQSVHQLSGVDFSPSGDLVAGVQSTQGGAQVVVVRATDGAVTFREVLPGAAHVVWEDDDTLLVLDKNEPDTTVHRCDLSEGTCVTNVANLGHPGIFGYGVWLVRGSFTD